MKINKISKTNPNKFKFWITVLSLLSLIPFGILLYHLYQLQLIATTEKENESLVNLVLDRTISSPLIMSGFIIGLMIWISNSVISSIAVHKKILPSWFGYLTLILGGLGSHAIALFFRYISNKIKPSSKQLKRMSKERSILLFIPGVSEPKIRFAFLCVFILLYWKFRSSNCLQIY